MGHKAQTVSVNVPTLNSERTINECLKSIVEQTYPDIEVIVVDSYSHDRTVEIAQKYGVKVIYYAGGLLGARVEGLRHSKGDLILLLDSDQLLHRTIIERTVKLARYYDMVILGEESLNSERLIQRLFAADRKMVHEDLDLNPLHGVLMPRLFKRRILEETFRRIPERLYSAVFYDHAIIYYEASRIAKSTGFMPSAVYHIEPENLSQVIKKYYKYGATSKLLLRDGKYAKLVIKKNIPRKAFFKLWKPEALASLMLWLFKAVAYAAGCLVGE